MTIILHLTIMINHLDITPLSRPERILHILHTTKTCRKQGVRYVIPDSKLYHSTNA